MLYRGVTAGRTIFPLLRAVSCPRCRFHSLIRSYICRLHLPAGLDFLVNGLSYSQPESFQWPSGSSVTLSAISPQQREDGRFTFANWSNGGAITHTLTAPAGNAAYIANFNAEYMLRVRGTPAAGGTVAPSVDSFYPANTAVTVSAIPSPGYMFDSWGGAPITTGTGVYILSAPAELTAIFRPIGVPSVSWSVIGKAGPSVARMWNLSLRNNGPGGLYDARITQLTLTQTTGPACTPVLETKLPFHVGNPGPGVSEPVTLFLNMLTCGPGTLFQLNGVLQVNGGTPLNFTFTGQAP